LVHFVSLHYFDAQGYLSFCTKPEEEPKSDKYYAAWLSQEEFWETRTFTLLEAVEEWLVVSG